MPKKPIKSACALTSSSDLWFPSCYITALQLIRQLYVLREETMTEITKQTVQKNSDSSKINQTLQIAKQIAQELTVKAEQVSAAIQLLDEGATVPFVARYRKEATGGLDDTQLRTLEERLTYLRELDERKQAVLKSIKEQDKLTPELEKTILAADTKTRVEDLYLPYKPKRRTKAQIAKEAGIEPLALQLLENHALTPETEAEKFINAEKGFADIKAVLDGAKQILMEKFAEDAELIGKIRDYLWQQGIINAAVVKGK